MSEKEYEKECEKPIPSLKRVQTEPSTESHKPTMTAVTTKRSRTIIREMVQTTIGSIPPTQESQRSRLVYQPAARQALDFSKEVVAPRVEATQGKEFLPSSP